MEFPYSIVRAYVLAKHFEVGCFADRVALVTVLVVRVVQINACQQPMELLSNITFKYKYNVKI